MQSIFGQVMNVTACPHCHGTGKLVDNPCQRCHGRGLVEARKTIEVSIPAGVDGDVQVRVSGEGEAGPQGGPHDDLYLSFRVAPHPQLIRRGQDLVYELPVSVTQAVLGDRITVPTVRGETEVDLPAGTQPGRVIKIAGQGVPHLRSGRRGDQICVVRVVVPAHISAKERKLYEELGGRDGKPVEVRRGFFDHLRGLLRPRRVDARTAVSRPAPAGRPSRCGLSRTLVLIHVGVGTAEQLRRLAAVLGNAA